MRPDRNPMGVEVLAELNLAVSCLTLIVGVYAVRLHKRNPHG